jgi:hypothetical protein
LTTLHDDNDGCIFVIFVLSKNEKEALTLATTTTEHVIFNKKNNEPHVTV